MDKIVEINGEKFRVIGLGVTREDGKTFAHLASLTRGKQQRNGFVFAQICDWIEVGE